MLYPGQYINKIFEQNRSFQKDVEFPRDVGCEDFCYLERICIILQDMKIGQIIQSTCFKQMSLVKKEKALAIAISVMWLCVLKLDKMTHCCA